MDRAVDNKRFETGQLHELIRMVHERGSAVESVWLEVKGPELDLTKALGKGTLVKAIIGMANRDAQEAADHHDGYGYITVGVDDKLKTGIPFIDPTDVENKINSYIGAQPPVWTPHWVEFEGRHVLVIEVPPAAPGSPIYSTCKQLPQSESRTYPEGTVFVRHGSKTEPARQPDINRLAVRAGAENRLRDVTLKLVSGHVHRLNLQAGLDDWLTAQERSCLSSLTPTVLDRINTNAYLNIFQTRVRETRTRDQYITEVDAYIEKCREQIPRILDELTTRLDPLTFELVNNTDRYWQGLEIAIHVPGDSTARRQTRAVDEGPQLPKAPRAFGDYYHNPLNQTVVTINHKGTLGRHITSPLLLPGSPRAPRVIIEDATNSVRVTLTAEELRPRATLQLPAVIITTNDPLPGIITADWTLTGRHDGIISERLELPTSATIVTGQVLLDGNDQ